MCKSRENNLDEAQWEALCDRCGKCCLVSLQDEDSGEIYHTNIACRHYDIASGKCVVYAERLQVRPECIKLNKDNISKISWLPKTCAYRALFDKDYKPQPLKPLKGRVVSENEVNQLDMENYIVDWDDL